MEREENMRRSGTRRSGTTNALCPQSTYRTLPYSFLSLSRVPHLSFSFYLSIYLLLLFATATPASQERIDLWGRFDLPKGLSLDYPYPPPIYPSFPPSTTRTRAPHTPSPSPLSHGPASKFIRESSFPLCSSATVAVA